MNEFKKTWIEGFKDYAIDIARIYATSPEHIISCLGFDSVCGSLNETYLSLVGDGEIEGIDKISESEKLRIWNKSKEVSSKKDKCIMISRSIYLLEKLTDER